tara:strand:+ start:391 stop:636 length:246 start_codon:yes stop_codon:yes gene_type:complete
MHKQKLSRQASIDKAERDLDYANSREREKKRAQTQKKRRGLKKKGFNLRKKDVHHTSSGELVLTSVRNNRGNFGKGTKKEG